MRQFMIILIFVALGEAAAAVIPLPIAGSIYGLVFLLLGLLLKFVHLSDVEDTADFFLAILPVMFVVPAVGILKIWGDVKTIWLPVLGIIVLTFLAAMASTGWVAQWLAERRKK